MTRIIELSNADEEDELIRSTRAVIIFFGSPGCGHCRAITPTYNSLSDKYTTISFAYVDCSQIKVENIQGYPSFVGYLNGAVFNLVVGNDERSLINMIKSML